MKTISAIGIIVLLITSCSNNKLAQLPPAPASIDAVAKTIAAKKYTTTDLALVSTLISDKNNPYEWFDEMKDTTPFFRNYETQKKKFAIHFLNDSTAEITDEATVNRSVWKLDNQSKSGETPGTFLRLTMEKDEAAVAGQVAKPTITFSYKVLGIDDKQLLLETPNMFKSRKLAVLMKAE